MKALDEANRIWHIEKRGVNKSMKVFDFDNTLYLGEILTGFSGILLQT
ncbi:MAG: hypothetical protein Q4C02_09795 [Eubacteriales bacterium]|nr:hypothetical protein [Lachnospiraceae bacterium]MDO4418553.1 hypothetical protein [Eubacteriales bacterium]